MKFQITQRKTLGLTRKAGFSPRATLAFVSKKKYNRKKNKVDLG